MAVRLQERWQHFRESREPASLRVAIAFAVLTATLALYLATGPNPWEQSTIKRLASGKPLKLEHFIQLGLWWGALAGFFASLVGLATVRFWSRPTSAVYPDLNPPSARTVRWTFCFAIAAMLLAVWPRVSRLDHSLWNDEEYHLRTYVWGTARPTTHGALKFDAITWPEAVFGNEKGNNHVWSSVEVRLGHLFGGNGWEQNSSFSERSLRALPFATGILTVGVLVWLGAALGNPRAGLAAGLILALHPWHVRWSVEIRGYSTMLFGITVGLLCLIRALQTNRWRWWLGYAAAQALFLLCFAGSVYVVAAQNVVTLTIIVASRAPGSVRSASAFRLIVAGIFSFVSVALILGPHVPQIAAYLKSAHQYAPIGAGWFADLWSHLVIGLRPAGDPAGTSNGIAVADLIAAAPWKRWVIYGLIPLFSFGGLVALFLQDWRTRLVAGTLGLATALAIIHNSISGSAFLTWYVLYILPLFVLSIVWASVAITRLQPRSLSSLPLVAAVLYSFLGSPALARIMNVPRQPIRETVAAMRGSDPTDASILTASFGDGARQMLSYDPRLQILKTPDDLRGLIETAITGNKALFLSVRGLATVGEENPELKEAILTDPRWQRQTPVLGMEAMLSYEVYCFAPQSVERISLKP